MVSNVNLLFVHGECLHARAINNTLLDCFLLELGQLFQDLGRVPGNATFHVDKDPTQIALRINQVRLAIAKGPKTGNGQGRAVRLAHSTTCNRENGHLEHSGCWLDAMIEATPQA
jgi:hypothetical protein